MLVLYCSLYLGTGSVIAVWGVYACTILYGRYNSLRFMNSVLCLYGGMGDITEVEYMYWDSMLTLLFIFVSAPA